MNNEQLLRYSRHILLDEIGQAGQQRIHDTRILLIGVGGLGCPAALYLTSAGIGELTLVDHDQVEISNLQRQILHRESSVGQRKVLSAQNALQQLNTEVTVRTVEGRADSALLATLVPQHDIILDCSDNFLTRHAVNQACFTHRKPLVSGAAIRFDGQVAVYDPRNPQHACYACLFPADETFEEVRCALLGVFAPVVGIIGTMQATLALRLAIDPDPTPTPQSLWMLDGHSLELNKIQLHKRKDCPVCANR